MRSSLSLFICLFPLYTCLSFFDGAMNLQWGAPIESRVGTSWELDVSMSVSSETPNGIDDFNVYRFVFPEDTSFDIQFFPEGNSYNFLVVVFSSSTFDVSVSPNGEYFKHSGTLSCHLVLTVRSPAIAAAFKDNFELTAFRAHLGFNQVESFLESDKNVVNFSESSRKSVWISVVAVLVVTLIGLLIYLYCKKTPKTAVNDVYL